MIIVSRIIAMKKKVHRNVSNILGYTKTNQSLPADIQQTGRALSRQYFIGVAARAFAIAIIFLGTFAPTTTAAQNAPVSLNGETMRIEINSKGQVSSFFNKLTDHEYIHTPGELWKLTCREGTSPEIIVSGQNQTFQSKFQKTENGHERLNLLYETLQSDDRELNISLTITMTMEDDRLSIESSLRNNDTVDITKLYITGASGIQSLSNTPEKDYIAWPKNQGHKIINPAFSNILDNLDLIYPGTHVASMQWFDYCNDQEGLYIGSHDTTRQTGGLHIEKVTGKNVLRMGVVKYPFAKPNETWRSDPVVYSVHLGDWHAGAKIYRTWIEKTGWKAPSQPEWIRNFNGFLRVILKPQHGEINFHYSQIPQLFDEAKAAGLNTIYFLAWEHGGFGRMYPDYFVSEELGREKELRKSIDYVHRNGGRVMLFMSMALVDTKSEFYKTHGDIITLKDNSGNDIRFAETYSGEGTWRSVASPTVPQFLACTSLPIWQKKMKETTKYIMDLGADAVLYDVGAFKPLFCFDERHHHSKPNHAYINKDKNYQSLRDYIKTWGNDKAIAMEHATDIYGQYMDLVQPVHIGPGEMDHANEIYKDAQPGHLPQWKNGRDDELNKDIVQPAHREFPEMYRYTFPEIKLTNRDMALSEYNYVNNINHTFVYGLAFDMSVFRCNGTLSDIPEYTEYMSQVIALRNQHTKYLLHGTFIDTDGGSTENKNIIMKTYRAADGGIAAAVWNTSKTKQEFQIKTSDGKLIEASLDADSVAVYVLL